MQIIAFSDKSSLIQVMAYRGIGNKPLTERTMTQSTDTELPDCVNHETTMHIPIDTFHEVGDKICVSGIKQ